MTPMSEIEITDAMLDEIEASAARGSMLMPDRAAALTAEIRRLRADNATLRAKAAKFDQTDGMDGAACAAIRDLLKEFGAPPAAFIDDAVMNGLVHARRAALEEAAKIAADDQPIERLIGYGSKEKDEAAEIGQAEAGTRIAAAIRSLMDKEPAR